jgi:NAD(P)-dependent dehydrogenase (short-subunit alcohol dehydrogenase family)
MRTVVVTGSASGIGAATCALLAERGDRVVGVDLHRADVVADLGTREGRAAALDGVGRIAGDAIDAVIACAGHSSDTGTPEQIVRVNYFGAVATLEGLRPRLAHGAHPRAAVVSSVAALFAADDGLTETCLAGDEERAVATAGDDGAAIYSSAKRAVAHWVRRAAPTAAWAGAGIALNAVGPGLTRTPMTRAIVEDPEALAAVAAQLPQPLRAIGEPLHVASLLVWLTGPENGMVTGQLLLADGGFDALVRGDALPRLEG